MLCLPRYFSYDNFTVRVIRHGFFTILYVINIINFNIIIVYMKDHYSTIFI